MTPWLKKPIPLGFSGLFISGSRADASASRAWSCCGDDAKRILAKCEEMVGCVTYCGFGMVKCEGE